MIILAVSSTPRTLDPMARAAAAAHESLMQAGYLRAIDDLRRMAAAKEAVGRTVVAMSLRASADALASKVSA